MSKVAFIGISNWNLDASKMARLLIVNRPEPLNNDLKITAQDIIDYYPNINK